MAHGTQSWRAAPIRPNDLPSMNLRVENAADDGSTEAARHLRPGYDNDIARTSGFLPWPPRKET